MPSGPLIGKNFKATIVLQSFKAISYSFSIVSDEAHLTLALKAVEMPHVSQSPHKSTFKGKGHTVHVVTTKVDVAEALFPDRGCC